MRARHHAPSAILRTLLPRLPSSRSIATTNLASTIHEKFKKREGDYIHYHPVIPSISNRRDIEQSHIYQGPPVPGLFVKKPRSGGRNSDGRITVRGRGGGPERLIRNIDFERLTGGQQRVLRLEYDPLRSALVALLMHLQTLRLSYIIAPEGIKPGDIVESFVSRGPKLFSEDKNLIVKPGNCFQLQDIPPGTVICNVGLRPGKGGQLCRSAGTYANLVQLGSGEEENKKGPASDGKGGEEGKKERGVTTKGDVKGGSGSKEYAHVRLQSGETRLIPVACVATIGRVSNPGWQGRCLGKAGARALVHGRRPKVRGTAMNPVDHPHGGGEGKTMGRHPKTPWGYPAHGYQTRLGNKPTWWIVHPRRRGNGGV